MQASPAFEALIYPAARIATNVTIAAESASRENASAPTLASTRPTGAFSATYHTIRRLTNVRMPRPRCAATLGGLFLYRIVRPPTTICAARRPSDIHDAFQANVDSRLARHAATNVPTINRVRTDAKKRCVHSSTTLSLS